MGQSLACQALEERQHLYFLDSEDHCGKPGGKDGRSGDEVVEEVHRCSRLASEDKAGGGSHIGAGGSNGCTQGAVDSVDLKGT